MEAKLGERAKLLESDLRYALLAAEDVKALRAKTVHLIEELKREKELRMQEKLNNEQLTKNTEILEDHIEKMVKLIRVEAGTKFKMMEARRLERKELAAAKAVNEGQAKEILVQKRLIMELRQSSQLLVDQLRLMDQKYLDLREKVTQARRHQRVQIERSTKECQELRTKYALATGYQRLDDVGIPPQIMELLRQPSSSGKIEGYNRMQSSELSGFNEMHSQNSEDDVHVDTFEVQNQERILHLQNNYRPQTAEENLRGVSQRGVKPRSQLSIRIARYQGEVVDKNQLAGKLRSRGGHRSNSRSSPSSSSPNMNKRPSTAGDRSFREGPSSASDGNGEITLDRVLHKIHDKHDKRTGKKWTPENLQNLINSG